ncbi:MAG: Cna B-type domain-containing protein [Clostridia bacterium]|nr:Cna B-type domain-containing protein [Clostridia bacterium]
MRKLLTAFVVICLAILFLPPLALAQSDYITELTVSTATAESYERVKISVSFSDGGASDPVFHSGDTLTVSWPSVGGASLQGMTRTIHLVNPEGITYAHAYITPTGASVVFTDAVEGMSDVHGSFWFEATAVNKTDTTEENAETVVIHAGNKTAELIIHKGESAGISEGELPLFRKQADEIGGGWAWDDEVHGYVMGLDPSDPTYTQWILTVNEHMEEVHTDVKVHDLLGEGQSLDESYLRLYSGGAIKKTYEGTVREVIDAWEQDFPLSSLTFDESGNIDWVIDRQTADRTYWNLTYRCDIIDFEKALLSNSAEISYTDGQDHPQLLHDESYFFNTDAGGGAEGLPPGMVRVRKRVAGTELGIAGVVFRLEKKALDGTWDLAGTLTTNADGIAVISRLKSGEYRLYEIEYPDYLTAAYTLDAPYFFTIDRENAEERGVELVAENALQLIDIEVQKRWLDADGNEDASAHPTMIFRLFRQSDAQNIPVHVSDRTLTSGAVTVTWADLPAFDVFGNRYTYTISELDEQENTWPESNVSLTGDAVQGFLLTNRATPSPSPSPTPTPTPTPAATPTATPSSAPTPTPTLTATPTATPSPTPMLTASPTPAVTPTIMPSPSSTPSPTSTPSSLPR